jgi:NAD(P)-dependent dehydrogenase (short-subunit alcohol dehydrogenase family)
MINFEEDEMDRRDFLSLGVIGGAASLMLPFGAVHAEAATGGAAGQEVSWKKTKALITGGTSGLGKVLVEILSARGAQVTFCGRRKDAGMAIESELKNKPGKVRFFLADVTKESDVKDFIKSSSEWMGKIDLAINCAGIDFNSDNFVDEPLDESIKVIQTNLIGMMVCLKYQGEQMKKQKSGSIVNLGSVTAVRGSYSGVAYSASKHGVVGLTKSLAKNFAPFEVRVNAVSPYIMDNMMGKSGKGRMKENHPEIQHGMEKMPLKRVIKLESVAEAVLWIGSDAAWNITGQNLIIDGGHLS